MRDELISITSDLADILAYGLLIFAVFAWADPPSEFTALLWILSLVIFTHYSLRIYRRLTSR